MTSDRKITEFLQKSPYHPETARNIVQSWPAFSRNLNDPQWLSGLRRRALDYLEARGLPTPKLEGWKFTNLIPKVKNYSTLADLNFVVKAAAGAGFKTLMDAAREQWVAGLLNTDVPGQDANADPSLMHLANVFLRDGVVIDVAAGVEVAEPLMIDVIAAGDSFASAQVVIRLGPNARLTIIEDHRGEGNFWKNILTRIVLEPGAKLTHIRIQEDSGDAVYTQATNIEMAKDASYEALNLATGAGLSRNQVRVAMNGPGGVCHINGVSLMRGTQHADTTILVDHFAPHCESNQNMRTILSDQAHGVFQGKIHVRQPAQKTNGYQLSKTLILSEGAEMDTKPELEIYADDVKCSHGATTGQMDEEPLFYMQSRGIGRDEAKALLVESFAAEALSIVVDQPWHGMLEERVLAWLR
jgi:Fe-S cluster assembly protein SufD